MMNLNQMMKGDSPSHCGYCDKNGSYSCGLVSMCFFNFRGSNASLYLSADGGEGMEKMRNILLQTQYPKIVLQAVDSSAGCQQISDKEGSEKNNSEDDEASIPIRS